MSDLIEPSNTDLGDSPDSVRKYVEDLEFQLGLSETENQQLKQRIEQLERERDDAKGALDAFGIVFNLDSNNEQRVKAREWLAQRDIEQQEKGVNHVGVMLTDMGFDGVESLCEKAIEQLRKPTESPCEHDWVSAKNLYIECGSFCTMCSAVSELEPEQLRKG